MNSESTMINRPARTPQSAPSLVKKIDKTTFVVRIHFSTASKESMEDKIKRMLKNDIGKGNV